MSKRRLLTPATNNAAEASVPRNDDRTPPQVRRPLRAALLLTTVLAVGITTCTTISDAWQRTQRHEAYLPDLERMAQHSPSDGPLLALLGGRLMEANEYSAAAETLRRSVATGEQEEAVWLALAASTAAAGEPKRAVADLLVGARAQPDAAGLKAALARCRALAPAQPPAAFAEAINPQGGAPLIAAYGSGSFLNTATQWWGRRHPEGSGFSTRAHWVIQKPEDAQALRLWGLALLRNRRLPEAQAALRHALKLAPDSPASNLAMADFWDRAGSPDNATLQYLTCLRLKPDWTPALFGLGAASSRAGLYGYATAAFARAGQLEPQSADAWIGLGRAYVESGTTSDYARALAAYQTAARHAPGRVDYLPDYANCLRLCSRWTEAEAVLRRRLVAAPDDAFSHFLLGMVLMNSDPSPARAAEAEAQTREALRLTPHAPQAEVQLAQLLLARDQGGEALPLLADACARDPYNRKDIKILARAYRNAGQVQAAARLEARIDALVSAQEKLVMVRSKARRTPMDAALHEQLAVLYRRTGDFRLAAREQALVGLIRSDPQSAARALQSLNSQVQNVLPSASVTPP